MIERKRRRRQFNTEEERQEARRETKRDSDARRRARVAQEKGSGVVVRKRYISDEERALAAKQKEKTKKRKKREKTPKEPWTPAFIGLDGESFVTEELLPDGSPKQAYCLLLRSDLPAIYDEEGLSTWACLDYLTKSPPRKTAFVGYFLNFDFEWILKDITQDEYKRLQHGEQVSLFADEYRIQWFVGKKLVVYKVYPTARAKEPKDRKLAKDYRMITFQDTSGFFQDSFVNALKKWGFAQDPRLEIITSGKAARGGFRREDLEEVSAYNAMEMELLQELMLKVYEAFRAAYEQSGLKFSVHSLSWSGAGVFANDFLKQTHFAEEHPPVSEGQAAHFAELYKDSFGNEAALRHPFSLAYFGGRIELAAVGRFGKTWNYDINSAYPYATSLLPAWGEQDFRLYEYPEKDLLNSRKMGMYGVHFNFPEGWTWYPFPVRSIVGGAPNVFYPRQGFTHIMSPELFAALDTLGDEALQYVSISYAYVLDNSDGYGDALNRMPEERLSFTARKTSLMADVRLKCKAAGKRVGKETEEEGDYILGMAEKGLKLILNSLYGKTVQQVGSHKYYSDFASAWITSTCRALLWRAIEPEKASKNVLMTMTDGVYSLVPLKFPEAHITTQLGDWEGEAFSYMETFKPGVYRYEDNDGMHYKVRGFLTPTTDDKERLFSLIWDSITTGSIGRFPAKQFLTRNVALEGWKREPYLRQFYTDLKDIKAELRAKRAPNVAEGWKIPLGASNVFFMPKREHEINDSIGYALAFEESRKDAEEEEWEDYLNMMDSIIGLEELYETA